MPDMLVDELMGRKHLLAKIVADVLKCDPVQVTESTRIDRTAIHSSLMIHRMYSLFKKEGFDVSMSLRIKTFGELLAILYEKKGFTENISEKPVSHSESMYGVGIDLEEITDFPLTNNYRVEEFYVNNFSPNEISYSILQADPRVSFAGLFAAKEAIVKSDNWYRNFPFREIELKHDENGRPLFPEFGISISHTKNYAVAVALRSNKMQKERIKDKNYDLFEKRIERTLKRQRWLLYVITSVNIVAVLTLLIALR